MKSNDDTMKRIALFPGSFDPYTIGHHDIITRSIGLFDKIIIGVGINSTKKYLNTTEERVNYIKQVYINEPKVDVVSYQELTINFCKKVDANYILRGLRNTIDFEYEKNIALMNLSLESNIETIFLMCSPQYSHINSSVVKEVILNGGNVDEFLPLPLK